MVKDVLVHIELGKAVARVGPGEARFPAHARRLRGFKVDPDEAAVVDVHMDREEAVLGLVKPFDLLEAWGFGQAAVQAIRPTCCDMINTVSSQLRTGPRPRRRKGKKKGKGRKAK